MHRVTTFFGKSGTGNATEFDSCQGNVGGDLAG